MASIHRPIEPPPPPAPDGEQQAQEEEEEGTSDDTEDDEDEEDEDEHNRFHISANPSASAGLPLSLHKESLPNCASSLLPLVQSSSRALIPFTGSFPAIPSPSPVITKPVVVAFSDSHPASQAPTFTTPVDGNQPLPDANLPSKTSFLEVDPEPERRVEGREHKKRSKNWTRPETLTLIRLRTELAPRFAKSGRKSELWDEIAESLQKGLFYRDAQQCRDKWEKLMAGYKEVRDGVKHKEDNPYYEDLYPLLSGRPSKRERESDTSTDRPPAKAELSKASIAVDGHIHHPYQSFKSLPVDGHHSQPFKSLVTEGHHHHPSLKALAMDVHPHQPSLKPLSMTGHLHHDLYEAFSQDGHQQLPLRGSHISGSMTIDNHSNTAEYEDASEEKSHMRKQRKGSNTLSVTDLNAVQGLLESIVARQQNFFKELFDGIEKKEELREQMRQEREEKWRAEERAQRQLFTEAMQILMERLGGINGVVEPSVFAAVAPHLSIHVPPVSSPVMDHQGQKRRSKNWKRSEVLQLIRLRGEMEKKFAKSTRRAALWGDLADALSTLGIRRDGKQCREKWDKLMAEYKDVVDGKKEKGDSPYYPELQQIAEAGSRGGLDIPNDGSMSGVPSKPD